jgi:hypothetical protein
MQNEEGFLELAGHTFIDDLASILRIATTPARIACRDVATVLQNADTRSQRRYETSQQQAKIYKKFVNYKRHYALSPTSDGKLVHYFLCSIETLPFPRNEEMIFNATTFIDAQPELAVTKISEVMRNFTNNMLNQTNLSALPFR